MQNAPDARIKEGIVQQRETKPHNKKRKEKTLEMSKSFEDAIEDAIKKMNDNCLASQPPLHSIHKHAIKFTSSHNLPDILSTRRIGRPVAVA